jgi:hypothetical protein
MQPSIERKLNFSPLRILDNFTFEECYNNECLERPISRGKVGMSASIEIRIPQIEDLNLSSAIKKIIYRKRFKI